MSKTELKMNNYTDVLENLVTERTENIGIKKDLFAYLSTLKDPIIGVLLYPENKSSLDKLKNQGTGNSELISHFGISHSGMKGLEYKKNSYKVNSKKYKINLWVDQSNSVYTCVYELGLVESVNFYLLNDSYFRHQVLKEKLIEHIDFYSQILRERFPNLDLYGRIIITNIQSLNFKDKDDYKTFKWDNPLPPYNHPFNFDLHTDQVNTEKDRKEEITRCVQTIKDQFVRIKDHY